MIKLLQKLYQSHHQNGSRLRQSLMEVERGKILSRWIGANKKVLDLGCRDGTLTRHFIENNQVTGADIDIDALNFAKKTYKIDIHQVDLNSVLPFENEAFDVIVMGEVLEHLPYLGITLPEVKRILKRNGKLVGSIPLAYHVQDRIRVLRGKKLLISADPTHLQFLSYDDFIFKMKSYFNVKEIVVLQGGKGWKSKYPRFFARNIAFCLDNI
jgi:SAM-dependent methyltransferase